MHVNKEVSIISRPVNSRETVLVAVQLLLWRPCYLPSYLCCFKLLQTLQFPNYIGIMPRSVLSRVFQHSALCLLGPHFQCCLIKRHLTSCNWEQEGLRVLRGSAVRPHVYYFGSRACLLNSRNRVAATFSPFYHCKGSIRG